VTAGLPQGAKVRIRDDVRALDSGRLLVGGSPVTAMRLTDRARALVTDRQVEVATGESRLLAERLLAANIADPVLSGGGADPDELTVVIPVRDRIDELDRALSALYPTLVCLVVDDGSRDPAAVEDVCARHGAGVLHLRTNVGPAAARNAGLSRVTTTYVAFVDSDVVVASTTLLALTAHFMDPSVTMVAPRLTGRVRSPSPRWFERYDEAHGSLDLGSRGCSVAPGAAVAWVPSACLVARTTGLGAGFDASLRVGEDVDLVWRLVGEGRRVRYDPTHVATHDVRSSVRGWLGRKAIYGTGGALLAERHGSHVAVAVLSPEYAVVAAVLLLRGWSGLPFSAAVVATGSARLSRQLGLATPSAVSVRLAVQGLGWALRQESSLLLRHWWPPVALGCLVSRRLRRAVGSALLVDMLVARTGSPTQLVARRLDDLAYGGGLWWGVVRRRSLAAVQVRLLHPRRRPSGRRRPA